MNSKGINRNVWALTLSLCLGVIGFSALSAQAADPQKATERKGQVGAGSEQKSQPTGVEMKQPATGEKKTVDQASPKLITGKLTGKVTGVDPTAKTFTTIIQGRAITFSAARLSKLPTVGENMDITFTLNPDGELPLVTSTARPGSTTDSTPKPRIGGGNEHCNSHSSMRPPFRSLNVCSY